MSESYEEIFDGQTVIRRPPGVRHEFICTRLHQWVNAGTANLASARLLRPRSQVQLSLETMVCPDLALVTVPLGKLWLAAEVVSSDDHSADTVVKKQLYEDLKLPRLWMVDPRYDNVEVYHGGRYGLVLKLILAGKDVLTDKLLPEFQMTVAELFQTPSD